MVEAHTQRADPRLLVIVAALATACGSASLPTTVVVGRYESPPAALWERSVSALRQTGYEPVAADPAHGRIAVASRSRPSTYGGARFELQLFRQGWVQVRLAGPLVAPDGQHRVRVPNDLAQEYEAFVFDLVRILGTASDSSASSEGS